MSKNPEKMLQCVSCERRKLKNESLKPLRSTYRAAKRLWLIEADICGSVKVLLEGGSVYFLTFLINWSRITFLYFSKQKSEEAERPKEFIKCIKHQTRCNMKHIFPNQGEEGGLKMSRYYLLQPENIFEETEAYKAQQNGFGKCRTSVFMNEFRSMMLDIDVPMLFPAGMVVSTVYWRNLTSTAVLDWKSLLEL